jgi:hypothetical protein
MIAYDIQQPSTQTNLIASDLMDVLDVITKVSDGTPVQIITKEMTVSEFEKEVQGKAALQIRNAKVV